LAGFATLSVFRLSFVYEPLNDVGSLLLFLLPCSGFVEAFYRKESLGRTALLVLTGATGFLSTSILLFSLLYYGEFEYLLQGKEPPEGPQSEILQEVNPSGQSHKIVLMSKCFMEILDPSYRWSIDLYFIRRYGSFLQEKKLVCTVRPATDGKLRISEDQGTVDLTVTPCAGYGSNNLGFDFPTSWNSVRYKELVLTKAE